ncbi:MAG: hypothetical protein QG586_1960 [Pseudomonadota bacterium]|nr:hypothetical protein [Pseudomonadota bacterium]
MTIRRGSMLVIAFLLASPGTAAALGSDCKFTADRTASLDTRGVERVEIFARAGDLTVKPGTGTTLSATGRACASNEKYLEQTQVKLRREGNVLQVQVQVPEDMQGIGIFYASLDLNVALPATLPVEITDSSGDMTLEGVRVTRVLDSSGDILARGLAGDVEIEDSSGDISVLDQAGALRIADSSGDIVVRGAREVLIPRDSSGDIRIEQISGSVRIEQDSSGQVRVSSVQGAVKIP